jgi:hypothetical protein
MCPAKVKTVSVDLLYIGRGQGSFTAPRSRVLARVLKTEVCEFPSVFEYIRVVNLAINAHEII